MRSIMGRVLALAAALVLAAVPTVASAAPTSRPNPAWNVPQFPGVGAWSAVLLDWTTGQVLWEKNAFTPRDPASTTKVLTALVALERKGDRLNELVKVSRRAAYTPGSAMYIKPGEVYSLYDLLHGLLLRSGNDAATAIAEHVAGSVEEFAKLMNAKAREVGALNTHFVNPHGLTHGRHRTTAYDLALITRAALAHPRFQEIVSKRQVPLTYEQLNRSVVLHNTNRLLDDHRVPEADGVKTGTTSAAGPCLVASATKGDQKLVAVVLHAGNRWGDAAALLRWGLDNFELLHLARKGDVMGKAPVVDGKSRSVPVRLDRDLSLVVPRLDQEKPQMEISLNDRTEAPIRSGQPLGRVTVKHGGSIHSEGLLVAERQVAKANLLDKIYQGMLPLWEWLGKEELF